MEHRLEATRGDSGQTFDDWVRLTLNPVREHLGDIFYPRWQFRDKDFRSTAILCEASLNWRV